MNHDVSTGQVVLGPVEQASVGFPNGNVKGIRLVSSPVTVRRRDAESVKALSIDGHRSGEHRLVVADGKPVHRLALEVDSRRLILEFQIAIGGLVLVQLYDETKVRLVLG